MRRTLRAGYTLIELMIAVAVVGVLIATAIANFSRVQLRSRAGEARTQLAAIRTAEEGYFAEHGSYAPSGLEHPPPPETNQKRLWVPTASGGFDTLGFVPEGEVYFTYFVAATTAPGEAFSAGARGDLDADGTQSFFAYMKPAPGAGLAIPLFGGACAATGVYDGVTMAQDLLRTVGPCDGLSGVRNF